MCSVGSICRVFTNKTAVEHEQEKTKQIQHKRLMPCFLSFLSTPISYRKHQLCNERASVERFELCFCYQRKRHLLSTFVLQLIFVPSSEEKTAILQSRCKSSARKNANVRAEVSAFLAFDQVELAIIVLTRGFES